MRLREKTDHIVIHSAKTPNGSDLYDASDVWNWHVRQRGWSYFGYHWILEVDGYAQPARWEPLVGAHCPPVNYTSVSVCMMGTDAFTLAQWTALRAKVEGLLSRYPGAKVIGDRDKQPHKKCPGFDVQSWLDGDMEPLEGHIV